MKDNIPVIPIPITELLKEFVDYREYIELKSNTIIQLIGLLDPNEDYCHIEFPSHENPIPRPRLYTKATWLVSNTRLEAIKASSENERRIHGERNEAWSIIFSELLKITGLNPKNKKHNQRISRLTAKLIEAKAKGLNKLFGIDISNLPDSPYKNLKKR